MYDLSTWMKINVYSLKHNFLLMYLSQNILSLLKGIYLMYNQLSSSNDRH